jgi:hypothetical protein
MSEPRSKFATFVDAFVPGRVKPSSARTGVDVSWNGTSSVPSGAIEEALFKRFKEMHSAEVHSPEHPTESVANE